MQNSMDSLRKAPLSGFLSKNFLSIALVCLTMGTITVVTTLVTSTCAKVTYHMAVVLVVFIFSCAFSVSGVYSVACDRRFSLANVLTVQIWVYFSLTFYFAKVYHLFTRDKNLLYANRMI